ncbi:unnamed protein product [Oppiella nova]|uniref:Arrestin C-terminal-like domain-containing protein n=1 Tax=Oppiella nova TaxID=334625 RepID=A0A7R9QLL1_9ACAR|nr:unnamed protein product [Oppiella nova]CAG2168306.1 unnamed protein product [Oppiella nova]
MDRAHISKLDISLDNQKQHYLAGDKVSGLLQLTILGPEGAPYPRIGLVCVAESKWVESAGTYFHREGQEYKDQRTYVDLAYKMPAYSDKFTGPGEHVIPFEFTLPDEGIPASFESPYGSIRYYITANIDQAHKITYKFTVDSPMQTNFKVSVGGSVEKVLAFPSIGGGIIRLHTSLVKKGFAPGDTIALHCTVENHSTVDATPRVTLYETQVYMCGERHKSLQGAVAGPVLGHTVGQQTCDTQTVFVAIPATASLSIRSWIVSVKYMIHVTLDIPYTHDMHVNLPVVVVNKEALVEQDKPIFNSSK